MPLVLFCPRNRRLLQSTLLAGLGIVSLAGQTAPIQKSGDGDASEDASALPDILVTARHRKEAAQRIGAAISTIDGEKLKEKNITSVNDLRNATPSLEVEPAFGGGQPQFRLRGIGFIDYTANNASPVGINVDDVAFALPIQTQGMLFDIDRVEIQRGPQGTLYGRNTTGGTVNFITRKPTDRLHYGITGEYGSFDAWNTEGYISGPIGNSLRGRLSFANAQGGAWQKNRDTGQKLGDKDKLALRGQLAWDVNDALDLHLTVQHAYDRSEAQGMYVFENYQVPAVPYVQPNGPRVYSDGNHRHTGWGLSPVFARQADISGGAKPHVDNQNDGFNLVANWQLGQVLLTSISAYNDLRRRELGDWDASRYHASDVYFDDRVGSFTQELRLSSSEHRRLNWQTGLFYSNDRLNEKFYSDFRDTLGYRIKTSYVQKVKTLGAFGQLDYAFSDRLKGILGLRQEYEKRGVNDYFSGFINGTGLPRVIGDWNGLPLVSVANPFPSHTAFVNNGTSGKLALEYQPSPGRLLYASYSRGLKSGGYTAHNSGDALALTPFKPESVNAYEIGFKGDLTHNFRLNGALFYYDYHDQQVLGTIWSPLSQSLVGSFVNAPRSRIFGGELEALWAPLQGLEIEQYLGYKEGKYTKNFLTLDGNATSAAGGTEIYRNYKNANLSFPKISYGGSLAYSWPLGDFKLRAETDYSYHDQYKQTLLLGSRYTVDAYWLVNANLTLAPQKGRWTLGLWSHNLLDEQYDLTRNFFLPEQSVAAAGAPRSVGLRASYEY